MLVLIPTFFGARAQKENVTRGGHAGAEHVLDLQLLGVPTISPGDPKWMLTYTETDL